jgi:hypothetical protein
MAHFSRAARNAAVRISGVGCRLAMSLGLFKLLNLFSAIKTVI